MSKKRLLTKLGLRRSPLWAALPFVSFGLGAAAGALGALSFPRVRGFLEKRSHRYGRGNGESHPESERSQHEGRG